MEEKYQAYEKNLKGKGRFSFWGNPKYTQVYQTDLSAQVFVELADRAMIALGWDVVYKEEALIEAKAYKKKTASEKITAEIDESGLVTVISKKLTDGAWDFGKNHIRIQHFWQVFQEILGEQTEESLQALVKEAEDRDNWADYEIPKDLPEPPQLRTPNFYIPLFTTFAGALLLSALYALGQKFFYILLLYESLIAIGLTYCIKFGMQWGNYTNYSRLKALMICSTLGTVIFTESFQYLWIINEQNISWTFFDFLKARFEAGFTLEEIELGGIGWMGLLILQIVLIYLFCDLYFAPHLITYTYERVPSEVIDFAYYLYIIKDNTEEEMNVALAKMGWSDSLHQQYVFEALESLFGIQVYRRME